MISVDYKFTWINFWLVLGQPNTLALLHKLYCTRAKLVVVTSKVDIVWLCPESMALIASFSLTLMHRESEQLSNIELDNVYGLVILLKCHGHAWSRMLLDPFPRLVEIESSQYSGTGRNAKHRNVVSV